MITNFDYMISNVDVVFVPAPLDIYCCKCNHKIRKGTTVNKVDGATFFHAICPNFKMTHPAAHKVLYPKG